MSKDFPANNTKTIIQEPDSQPIPQLEEFVPGAFEPENHFYTRVLNSTIHPLVSFFLRMGPERIIARYCHLNPQVDKDVLEQVLSYSPNYLRWSGADLFHVTTASGVKRMVVIETNSSPSGQKSMPLFAEHQEQGGYRYLLEHCLKPAIDAHRMKNGLLAVFYDKNYMEATGYAATMADIFNEKVHLVPWFDGEDNSHLKIEDRTIHLRMSDGTFTPIRAALRYVTQKPWNRIPINCRTLVVNPILACIAGGRNKMVASMAYDMYNGELSGSGLQIQSPETVRDVSLNEVPLIVRQFGGHAAIKIPYSNAGQGVFTVTSAQELEEFMSKQFHYDKFIVQSLIGNYEWSSEGALGKFYHVGTVPNRTKQIFVADLRLMIGAGQDGYRPLAIYGRRARLPLVDNLTSEIDSWDVLGTNLSVKLSDNKWDTETSRLLLMDSKDFNSLGVGLDDLIQGYIQSVLSSIAIDKMACSLVTKKGQFSRKLFSSVNPDEVFLKEILI